MTNALVSQEETQLSLSDIFRFERSGLRIVGNPTMEQWASYGNVLAAIENGYKFAIGDWLHYGENYGETYAQIADRLGIATQTLTNMASICSRIPLEERRHELTFAHHATVAYMKPEIRRKFLQDAIDEGLTVARLRDRVRKHNAVDMRPSPVRVQAMLTSNGELMPFSDNDIEVLKRFADGQEWRVLVTVSIAATQ